jgi:hypothetical protein
MKKKKLQYAITVAVIVVCCFLELFFSWKYSEVTDHQTVSSDWPWLEADYNEALSASIASLWTSRVHCIGENFQNVSVKSARFRSCRYSNLCWNGNELVFYESPDSPNEYPIYSSTRPAPVQMLPNDPDPWMPSIHKPSKGGVPFPFLLPNDTVWIPIRSTSSFCQRSNVS